MRDRQRSHSKGLDAKHYSKDSFDRDNIELAGKANKQLVLELAAAAA